MGSLGEHIPTEDGTAPPETLRSSTGSESGVSMVSESLLLQSDESCSSLVDANER